ncbi:diphthine--ammonia ligase [Saccharomycopsis crataegensis]|uniref:Diphthine--ammonia ligase n=1 Tax=Saccharomycopsis crataegensis TaxID=43959 RepID=A0AAV5QX80_9ASCO|nr:diphthine--ammonia ligase [Saccharomycopsis crataegensis]
MKFVALVSGGKDSCFNILHCLSNGHELVALANLYPKTSSSSEEIDSFMYQTVGYTVLQNYQECIGVPMYRKEILGTSKNVGMQYQPTLDDETEDLYELLSTCKQNHPDLTAVSVGAILSSYQRIRVEHVCQRLGLTSLAYLWQRNQNDLMGEMCGSGMDARILKVAAFGLNQDHLGLTLNQIYPQLVRLNSQFDIHICGEGGEFETIVLDAPFFINKKIVTTEQKIVRHMDDDVFYLQLKTKVEDKTDNKFSLKNTDWSQFITQQPLLTDIFKQIYDSITSTDDSLLLADSSFEGVGKSLNTIICGNKLFISNITSSAESIDGQTTDIFYQLERILKKHNIESTANIISTNLLVAAMSEFSKINSIYMNYFPDPLPPSRTCVETILPKGKHLQLSAVVLLNNNEKQGLHVQGRSYWAPANIGPYSQAGFDTTNYMANLAGQIPLIPAIMELPNENNVPSEYANNLHQLNTALSLKHIVSVKDVIGCDKIGSFICYVTDSIYIKLGAKAFEEYNTLEYEENFVDPVYKSLLIVKVGNLPKNAEIEWSGVSYKQLIVDEDSEEEEEKDQKPTIESVCSEAYDLLKSQGTLIVNNREFVSTLTFNDGKELAEVLTKGKKLHFIVFAEPTEALLKILDNNNGDNSVEFIPVQQVTNYKGELMVYGLIVRGSF